MRLSTPLAVVSTISLVATLANARSSDDVLTVAHPFALSVVPSASSQGWFVHYDFGYADRATETLASDGVEQSLGVEGPIGFGFAVRARLATAEEDGRQRTAWDAELLRDLLATERGFHFGIGAGSRNEWDGTTVAIGRITLGQEIGRGGIFANLRLERPFARARDAVDIITTLGWTWRASRWARVGVEAFGEDLEGLWEAEEAEGGAKLMAGPSIAIVPWANLAVSLCAGPIFYVTRSTGAGAAATNDDTGYLLRLSIGRSF